MMFVVWYVYVRCSFTVTLMFSTFSVFCLMYSKIRFMDPPAPFNLLIIVTI